MKTRNNLALAAIVLIFIPLTFASCSILYTLGELHFARQRGLYPSPQEAVKIRAQQYYRGIYQLKFDYAGTNSFDGSNPHVWYVGYTVYADSHADGTRLYHGTYERAGGFYLHIKGSLMGPGGWVQMPEGLFPQFIGFWMKVLGIAG